MVIAIENVDENNLVTYPSGINRNCRVEFQYDGNEYSFVPFQVNTDEYDQNNWETGNIRCAGFGGYGTLYKVNGKFPWSLGQKIADTTTPDDDSWQSMTDCTVGAPIPEMTNVDSSGCFGNQYNGNCKIDLEEAITTNSGACTEEDGDACDYCNDCLPNTDQLSVTNAYQIVKDRCDE
eukprot:Pgem_evm1s19700